MGTSPFLVGDTSSNSCFSIVMLVFRGVIYTPDVLFYSKRDLQAHDGTGQRFSHFSGEMLLNVKGATTWMSHGR